MKQALQLVFLLALGGVALSACGGGGGGGSSSVTSVPRGTTTNSGQLAFNASPSSTAIGVAATAEPLKGSFTQSSNVDAAGKTTDQASASFLNSVATVTVKKGETTRFTFSESSTTAYHSGTFTAAQLTKFAPSGHTSGRFAFHYSLDDGGDNDNTNDTVHADYIGVSWKAGDSDNNTEPDDHLIWGYWMRANGNLYLPTTQFEVGAFVDGPEFRTAPTLPSSGTASYSGEGQGIYHHTYGSSHTYAGAIEIGQYVGDVAITANFGTAALTLSTRNISIWGWGRLTDGRYYRFDAVPTDYSFGGTATISTSGEDIGQFYSTNVTLTNSTNPVSSVEGSFGGVFSNTNVGTNESDPPRMVVGTTGAKYLHTSGDRGSWVGTFGAKKQ